MVREILELAKRQSGKEINWKLEVVVERQLNAGFCDGCLFRMRGRKDMLRPELLRMSDKIVETDSEISHLLFTKKHFRCCNCGFEFVKDLKGGEYEVIVKNPEVLDRIEKELRNICGSRQK